MKLEFETNTSADVADKKDFVNGNSSPDECADFDELLQAGIKAAQEGDRTQAKQMLLQATEIDPGDENAWFWLASISEYPEELLGFLNKVLKINPQHERASEWRKSTKVMLANNLVQRGCEASKNEQKEFARQCFDQAIVHDAENEMAWLWLSSVSDCPEEKTKYLQRVLNLNPENENAVVLLKSLKNQKTENNLKQAIAALVTDDNETAEEKVDDVLMESPQIEEAWVLKSFLVSSFSEKIGCFEKIMELNPDSELANLNWTALLEIKAKADLEEVEVVESDSAHGGEAEENAGNFFDLENTIGEIELLEDEVESEEERPTAEPDNFSELPTQELKIGQAKPAAEVFEHQLTAEAFAGAASDFDFELDTENAADDANAEFNFNKPFSEIKSFDVPSYYQNSENVFENSNGEFFVSEAEETLLSDYSPEEQGLPPVSFDGEFSGMEDSSNVLPHVEFSEHEAEPEEESGAAAYYEIEEDILTYDASEESDSVQSIDKPETDVFELETFDASEESFYSTTQSDRYVSAATVPCPFCRCGNEAQQFVCNSCRAVLTLSDMEMLLSHEESDREALRSAVERMEAEQETRELSADDLKKLGIGHVNLKNLREGLMYLQEAQRLNPNDVVLSSQVNLLAIRSAEIEAKKSVQESQPKNRTILVVDDSATVRKLISGKLEKSGHTVISAADGVDALEKIQEIVPDLVLLDINMPRMDGYQVCKLIRSNEATQDIPVVMISGKDGFFDKVRGRMAGTTGYITKPFGPETLMKTVETYIN